jgi:hypothetical protein
MLGFTAELISLFEHDLFRKTASHFTGSSFIQTRSLWARFNGKRETPDSGAELS